MSVHAGLVFSLSVFLTVISLRHPYVLPPTLSPLQRPPAQHTASVQTLTYPYSSPGTKPRHNALHQPEPRHTASLQAHAFTITASRHTANPHHTQHTANAHEQHDTQYIADTPYTQHTAANVHTPLGPAHHLSLPLPHILSNPVDPSPRPNTHPLFTVFTPCPPSLRPRSTLHPGHWEALLEGYPDPFFITNIVGISTYGARIGFMGPPRRLTSPNHSSALRISRELTENITEELRDGRIRVIHDLPETYVSSPLGAVQKKSNGVFTGWRRIHDLSFPHGLSVNDGIPPDYGSLNYETLDDAIALIASHGQFTTLHKRDCKDAFRKIPVSPYDLWLLFFEWLGVIYADLVLPFGLATSPFLFNMFAEALHWILHFRYGQDLVHYLDDFLLIGGKNPSLFGEVCQFLGFEEKRSKSLDGFVVDFTGIELDTAKMEARLPVEKHERAINAVRSTLTRGTISFKDLRSLLGFLSFCCRVIPLGRPFLRNLFNHLEHLSHKHPSTPRRLSSPATSDLRWWATFLPRWHGKRLIYHHRPVFFVYTDAAGTKGIGGWWSSHAFSTRLPRRHRTKHINWKEAYAILFSIALWGDQWKGCRIIFMCDNSSISDAINKTSIRGEAISVLQLIFLGAALHDFEISSYWLPSEDNWIADSLSRFTLNRLANSQLNKVFAINHRTTGSPMSRLRRTLHGFFGLDSPPPPEPHTPRHSPTTNGSLFPTATARSLRHSTFSPTGSRQRSNRQSQTHASSTSQQSKAPISTEASLPMSSKTNDSNASSTAPSDYSACNLSGNEPKLHEISSPLWSTSSTPYPTTTSTSRPHSQLHSRHFYAQPSSHGMNGTPIRPPYQQFPGDLSASPIREPFFSFRDPRPTSLELDTPSLLHRPRTHAARSPPCERYSSSTLNPLAPPFSPVRTVHSTKRGCPKTSREPSLGRASTHSTSQAILFAEEQRIPPLPQVSPKTRSRTSAAGSPTQSTSTLQRNPRSTYNSKPTRNSTWPPRAGKSVYHPIPHDFDSGDEFHPRLSGPFGEDARQLSVASTTTATGPPNLSPHTSIHTI